MDYPNFIVSNPEGRIQFIQRVKVLILNDPLTISRILAIPYLTKNALQRPRRHILYSMTLIHVYMMQSTLIYGPVARKSDFNATQIKQAQVSLRICAV